MAHIWILERKLPQWKAWQFVQAYTAFRAAEYRRRIYTSGDYLWRVTKYVPAVKAAGREP